MRHQLSVQDQNFRMEFEAHTISPALFNHRAHIRLAYIYLAEHDTDAAHQLMRRALLSFLNHHGINVSKYHETMTHAWILAVRHFMAKTPSTESYDAFIEQNPSLLNSKIMLAHFTTEVLFSDEARAKFVQPNLDPIPSYSG
jgi:hypothetical protein